MPKAVPQPITPERAIHAALIQDWKQAIRINTLLVQSAVKDVDSLNRLGFAYLKSGQLTQAKKTYEKVLRIDPYNQIALNNHKKLSSLKKKDLELPSDHYLSPLQFLEEPGKTKIVTLVNAAPLRTLVTLSAGQVVVMKPKNHCVEIRTTKNVYLGVLPDDMSFKLLKLLSGGNQYQAIIKGIGKNALSVFIRETKRGKKFADQPSFSSGSQYTPRGRDLKDQEAPDVTPTGEDDADEVSVPEGVS